MNPKIIGWALALFALSFMMNSCTGKLRNNSLEAAPRPATENRSVDFLNNKIALREKSFQKINSLQAKVQLNTRSEEMSISATGTLIWKRDSLVWLNVKKFGFEALRVLITPDSVQILNRLEKSYSKMALESLRQQFNLPETNTFDALQKTILGLPIQVPNGTATTSIKDEKHQLRVEYPQFWADYAIEEGSYHLRKELFLLKKDNSMVALLLDRYQKTEFLPGAFPFSRTIEVNSPATGIQTTQIELESVQLNSNPTYKFEIPDHYSRK